MSCDLRASGWLARHPAVVLILVVLGLLVFGGLAFELKTNGPMVQWDTQNQAAMHAIATGLPGWLNEIMSFGFFMGKENLQLISFILILYFLHKRYWPEIGMVLIGQVGGSVIWTLLVYYFNRLRPQQQVGIEVKGIPSFPSGHSMFTVLALGLLAYLLVPKMPSLFWKWFVAIFTVILILFVGGSRVIQGNHYASDILAGYALALAWGTLVYALLEWIGGRRRAVDSG